MKEEAESLTASAQWNRITDHYWEETSGFAAEIGDAPTRFLLRTVGDIIQRMRIAGHLKAYVLKLRDEDVEHGDVERMASELLMLGANARVTPDLFTGKAAEIVAWLMAPEQDYDCQVTYPPHQPEGERVGYLVVRPSSRSTTP